MKGDAGSNIHPDLANASPPIAAGAGSGPHAAQANSDAEIPVLPSCSMPKALIVECVASAALNSDEAGWLTPTSRTGCPVSTPKGTMSSISKSIASMHSLVSIAPREPRDVAIGLALTGIALG